MNFQKTNNITGWIIFLIALAVYWLTMEETGSYWDCGEFIAVSYKLEVPHPPGAPLFLLIGRLFSFLSFGDVTQVAYWINFTSVLSSAFTILFLFWSIVLFGRKLLKISNDTELDSHTWLLMGAGAVGALAYTFSDSFWFSAVEAEVYAMSSFFTAFVVWAMLKWDVIEDESKANRWLILIFYMIGLSIGVHLLNLVTLPALGLIFYFKKYKPTTWGIVSTLLISGVLILLINDLIIPGLPTIAGKFELFFVNSIGLPFGSGAAFFGILIIAGLIWGIRFTQRNAKPVLNTLLLSSAFILIGYASYAIIVIRSNYDTPIDENDPSDVMSFVSYLKREQYGSRPLLYGQYFTAQLIDIKKGAPEYRKGKDKYEISDYKRELVYEPGQQTILPRIYSTDPAQVRQYRQILNLREGQKPTFSDNMRFMFTHQIGWMYGRYFLWNFAGRESDEQGADWLGPRSWGEEIPATLANKGRNNFFLIPFILGLVGMYFQLVQDGKNAFVVGLLFILTGVALVVYLNGPAAEPRERDYIYAASYYAYCIWIGLAVIGIGKSLANVMKSKMAFVTATLIGLTAPAIMAQQGWDDHNRANRYFSVDSAVNYLESCAPNAILFTGGDNDTFPLWYAQEVEGVRTDMRVVVLSYYNTDWYIEQSMRKHYESEPLPYTLSAENYLQGGPNDYLPFKDLNIPNMSLKEYIGLLAKGDNALRLYEDANVIPSRNIVLDVDVDQVKASGIVPAELDSLIVPKMVLRLKGNALEKKDLALLDVLLTNNWKRPVYVNYTSLDQFNVDLRPYVVMEGNTFRILPVRNPDPRNRLVNTEVAYNNIMKKFRFRGLQDSTIYYSEDYRNFVLNHRGTVQEVTDALIDKGEKDKARELLLYSLVMMPNGSVPFDVSNARNVRALFEVGEKEKAIEVASVLGNRMIDLAEFNISKRNFGNDTYNAIVVLSELQSVLYRYGEPELAKKFEDAYQRNAGIFQSAGEME
ncbi:MAG: DUF2723 domain-containing protein [Cyclobacteriaceae bacterium]|nr:DUF2723 domain-containing protein [Cyclobacteriaceae bacterium]